MFYSTNAVGNSTPEPNRNLRFYVNKFQLDSSLGVSGVPNLLCTDSRPDLPLGHHILDSQELTMIISAVDGRGADTKHSLTQYNVILEYE